MIQSHYSFLKKLAIKAKTKLIDVQTRMKQNHLGYPITLHPKGKSKGRVLYSYLIDPFYYLKNDRRFDGHTNRWESFVIAKIFQDLGYTVNVIDFRDTIFLPVQQYDVVFDIYQNLARIKNASKKKPFSILHMTGSYNVFGNEAEQKRIDDLQKRRPGAEYKPRRKVPNIKDSLLALETADACILMGNETTLETYPEKYRNKISLVNATSSTIKFLKSPKEFVPERREFLWFFGCGAVHKGLDLLLEIFSKHPELTLNIIGSIDGGEPDFFKIYDKELTKLPNIKFHGYLQPSNKNFIKILQNCFCFIAPSASEGMSPACATCMQLGLYPIVSKNCGITLPENSGVCLENCSIEEIEKAILKIYEMSKADLRAQISVSQNYALQAYSRKHFIKSFSEVLEKVSRSVLCRNTSALPHKE